MPRLSTVATATPAQLAPQPARSSLASACLVMFGGATFAGGAALLLGLPDAVYYALGGALIGPAALFVVELHALVAPLLPSDEEPTEVDADARIIPVYREKRSTIEGVDAEDLRDFVRVLCQRRDWSQATWRGQRLPSGKVMSNEYHARCMAIVANAGIVVDYGPRRKGRLTVEDADLALRKLNL